MEELDLISGSKDISHAVIKLNEAFCKGTGLRLFDFLFYDRQTQQASRRITALSDAYNEITLSQTRTSAEAKNIETTGRYELEELLLRTNHRLKVQEMRRQTNLESIGEKSLRHLPSSVSDQPLDPDWRTSFFHQAANITNEDIQEFWAKILANEVAAPGSVSLRTLNILSKLTPIEARYFEIALSLVSDLDTILIPWNTRNTDNWGLSQGMRLLLQDAQLLSPISSLRLRFPASPDRELPPFTFGRESFSLRARSNVVYNISPPNLGFPILKLTNSGKELARILRVPLSPQYVEDVHKYVGDMGFDMIKVSP